MSLLLLFNQSARHAVETLADPEVTTEDLRRLSAVLIDARDRAAPLPEVTAAIEGEVPRAARLAPLLQQGGEPLATWIRVILAAIMLILALREGEPAPPALTPDQLQEIVERAISESRKRDESEPSDPNRSQPREPDQAEPSRQEPSPK